MSEDDNTDLARAYRELLAAENNLERALALVEDARDRFISQYHLAHPRNGQEGGKL